MKHIGLIGIGCLFSFTSLWAQGGTLYIKTARENLRNGPNGSRIGELQAGTKVEMLEKKPNWVKVQLTGWIWEPSLTTDSTMVAGFTMRASHILVKTEAEAATILNELKSGADFAALASKYSLDPSSASKGGDVGEFLRGDLMPEFEAAVLKVKLGETSGIVKSSLGFHIIKRTK
jgi:hypothetical protein